MPLLFCPFELPAFDPGNFTAKDTTKIQCGLVNGQVVYGGPEFQLVSFAMALVAVVSSGSDVH